MRVALACAFLRLVASMEGELQPDKVFLRGLRFDVDKVDVEGAFAEYGLVDTVEVHVVRDKGQSLACNSGCVAFVTFMSAHSASAALELDGRWSSMLQEPFHVKPCYRKGVSQPPTAASWPPEAGPVRPLWRMQAWPAPPRFPPPHPLLPRAPVGPVQPLYPPRVGPVQPLHPPPARLTQPPTSTLAEGTTHVPRPPYVAPPLQDLASAVAEVLKKQVLCRSHEHRRPLMRGYRAHS